MSIGHTAFRLAVCGALTLATVGCRGYNTPLMDAARSGDLVTIREELKRGSRANFGDKDGDTALHAAAKHGQPDAIRLLIKEGKGTVDARDEDRQTPLHLACKNGQVEAAEVLIANGANVNIKEVDRWTALHFAARQGSVEMIQLLLKKGADLRARTNDNETAYDLAVDEGRHEAADYLASQMEKAGISLDN
jgi:ankyrin repeat protein